MSTATSAASPRLLGRHLWLGCLLLLTVGTLACTRTEDRSTPSSAAPEYADAGTIQLTEHLRLGETTGATIGRIGDLAVDSNGRIYIADSEYNSIQIFSDTGDRMRRIGRQGEAPGEFTRLQTIAIGRRDSLYAYDSNQRRISVFDPDRQYELAYSLSIANEHPAMRRGMMKPDTTGFLFTRSVPYSSRNEQTEHNEWLTWFDHRGGVIKDSLLFGPGTETLVQRTSTSVSILDVPFGRQPVFAVGTGSTVYHGHSDASAVVRYHIDGTPRDSIVLPYSPAELTDQHIEAYIGARYGKPSDDGRMRASRRETRRLLENYDYPDTFPAFRDLVVDDQQRLWFNRMSDPGFFHPEWRVVDPAAHTVMRCRLPEEGQLFAVHDNRAYVGRSDAEGFPEVVVYDMRAAD